MLELVGMGKRVILAGLDTTFANEPFGPVPALMALADKVTKLSAVCMTCGQARDSHAAAGRFSRPMVMVTGAAGMYEARCRAHFQPYVERETAHQMELHQVVSA